MGVIEHFTAIVRRSFRTLAANTACSKLKAINRNGPTMERSNRNRPIRVREQTRRSRSTLGAIYERAASERRRQWQQSQGLERSAMVQIARTIGTSVESLEHQAALCHEFNFRVSRGEVSFDEWASFVCELSRKFNRFLELDRFKPAALFSEVQNLIILGRLTYGDKRLSPVLRELGIFVNLYLDENGEHNIVQLRSQLREGPLPADDPVFHFLPYRHGSLEDITQRVGLMPLIPLEIALTMADRMCSICYYDFVDEGASSSESSLPSKLPCKHIFHAACLITWLAQNPTCPICREKTFKDL